MQSIPLGSVKTTNSREQSCIRNGTVSSSYILCVVDTDGKWGKFKGMLS